MSFFALFKVSSWYLADDVIRKRKNLTFAANLIVFNDLVHNRDVGKSLALGLADEFRIPTCKFELAGSAYLCLL